MFAAIDAGLAAGAVAAVRVSVSWIYKALGRRRAKGETGIGKLIDAET
jgi:hypothetical protein